MDEKNSDEDFIRNLLDVMDDSGEATVSIETQIVRKKVNQLWLNWCTNFMQIFCWFYLTVYNNININDISRNIFQAKEALDYVTNRKIFWSQQETPEKIRKQISKVETSKAKLIAISTFIKESIPQTIITDTSI